MRSIDEDVARTGAPSPSVHVARKERLAVVTLNRPDSLNAINNEMRKSLSDCFDEFERDDRVSVVVLRGAGERAFSVGADIKEFRKSDSILKTRKGMIHNSYVDKVAALTKPTIAAINGHCLGGGLEIALACDIRIASADARFNLPEVNLGLIPGGGGTQRLARIVGLGRALDILLTAGAIDAAEALRIGLITRLVESPKDLMTEAERVAHLISSKPPAAVAAAKEAAIEGFSLDLAAGLRLEKDLFALLLNTEDMLEAAAAFEEKRPPRFTGR